MRLLIYLLAMMTGLSAAEAARPVQVTPAALGSAIAHGAAVAASVAVARHKPTSMLAVDAPTYRALSAAPVAAKYRLAAASPVIRHDITLQ